MVLRLVTVGFLLLMSTTHADDELQLLESVAPIVEKYAASVGDVPVERREVLDRAAQFVLSKLRAGKEVPITFICTHNSRRSHLAQVWAQVAAEHYGLPGVTTFSGGTETTACNLRTIRAMRRAGLQVVATNLSDNPTYLVQYAENRPAIKAFSKVYDTKGNPQEEYAAMMCCADVDQKCPIVHGSSTRIPLHYLDPKASDGTPEESTTYDQRSAQIAKEMFYLFSRVASEWKDSITTR